MALPPLNDTIVAIATALGVGAVGIVRVSGNESFTIADKIFTTKPSRKVGQIPAKRVTFGHIYDGSELVDEALILTFHAPNSYTAQDVVEFQTHGGSAVLRKVLELCMQAGARLAKPGRVYFKSLLKWQNGLTTSRICAKPSKCSK